MMNKKIPLDVSLHIHRLNSLIRPEKSATELAVINCRKNGGANERRLKDQSKQTCACACTNDWEVTI